MNRVVVTGMGAVTPVGNDVNTFWNSLINAKNGIDFITHFDISDFKYKLAAEVKDFNPLIYIEKSIARRVDLFTLYALYSAEEAMQDSKLAGNIDSQRLGVYFGSGTGGFNTFCEEHINYIEKGARRVSPQFISKMISNIAAGNLAIKYNAKADCISVTTACATGTSAIGEAFRAIKHGYADAAICGGSEAAITPLAIAGFGSCMALSSSEDKNAASLPFDKRRNGFVMGEGAGTLILEEYEHAKSRGAKIYAEVCGYGSTCDAYHITAPDPEADGSFRAISNALKEACYKNEDKIYINAHGTGTPLNDKTETLAIKKALGDRAYSANISSTKSMTGHMLGAAGAIEAIAAILALCNSTIPPTIGLYEKDEECDLDYTPNTAKKAEINLSISSSFGFGGHNACIAFRKL